MCTDQSTTHCVSQAVVVKVKVMLVTSESYLSAQEELDTAQALRSLLDNSPAWLEPSMPMVHVTDGWATFEKNPFQITTTEASQLSLHLVFLGVDDNGDIRGCTATAAFKCQSRAIKNPGQRNKRTLDEIGQDGWRRAVKITIQNLHIQFTPISVVVACVR